MKNIWNVIKLFLLDWLVVLLMYGFGVAVVGVNSFIKGYSLAGVFQSLSSNGLSEDFSIYFFTTFSFVILIVYLLNMAFIKIPFKFYVISQLLFIACLPLVGYISSHLF